MCLDLFSDPLSVAWFVQKLCLLSTYIAQLHYHPQMCPLIYVLHHFQALTAES